MLLTDGARPSGACSTRSRVPAVHRRQLDPAVIDLCAHGSLAEVAELASRAVLEALGEHPKAVLLHLSRVTGGPDAAALEVLASGGAEVRAWPGVPIGVVCPDGGLAHRLSEFRDSRHLVIASHRSTVLAQLADGPSLDTVHATVVPAARSTSAMRQLVARTLLDWGCASQIGATTVVVNELVTSAMLQSDGDLQVMVARCGQRLRIEVRDTAGAGRQPGGAGAQRPGGRGMLLVAALAHSWGVLSTPDEGRIVWAVLAPESAHGGGGRMAAWASRQGDLLHVPEPSRAGRGRDVGSVSRWWLLPPRAHVNGRGCGLFEQATRMASPASPARLSQSAERQGGSVLA